MDYGCLFYFLTLFIFQSNAGYFDISSLNVGDTIGTADLIAAGGNINVNTMLVVSTIISSNHKSTK